jgi:hypothetical protein
MNELAAHGGAGNRICWRKNPSQEAAGNVMHFSPKYSCQSPFDFYYVMWSALLDEYEVYL